MRVCFISVPYDLDRRDEGMGRGPAAILDKTLFDELRRSGHTVESRTLLLPGDGSFRDARAVFKLNALISESVRRAVERGFFPLILAGSCMTTVGAVSGLHDKNIGLVWLDAHGDFNTPETTVSGYLDGMALSVACGRCWKALAASDPAFLPASEDHVFLVGARDFDAAETAELSRSNVNVVTSERARRSNWRILNLEKSPIRDLHIHLDADVLDDGVGRANRFASSGGLFPRDLEELLSFIVGSYAPRAFSITAYDPEYDLSGSILSVLRGIILLFMEKMASKS
jgi:arginase